MNWKERSKYEGTHAFLSPSNPHWLNYTDEKLRDVYLNSEAAKLGTRIHALAKEHIELGIKMPKTRDTLSMYINDGIGYHMDAEQFLGYSPNCYGTTDSVIFRKDLLRIHDLKTGTTPASMKQLEIYAALYCLEHDIDPKDIGIELHIYQNNEVVVEEPSASDISYIADEIVRKDALIEKWKTEV